MTDTTEFKGQNAIVTGGAQGIGKAIAARLMAGGGRVAIWDLDLDLANETVKELSSAGEIMAVHTDVTDLKSVEAARDATLEAFGTAEILVNNAGIAGPNAPTWEYDPRGLAPDHGDQSRRAVPLLPGRRCRT